MVKYNLDEVFGALADSTRREILVQLMERDCNVTDLAANFQMSLPAVSKHIHILETIGLLTQKKYGRERRCHLEAKRLHQALSWVEEFSFHWKRPGVSLFQSLRNVSHKT
jgi:DNA-binding transcriptional ArsR family regulator